MPVGTESEFLGRGFAFPLTQDSSTGSFAPVAGEANVEASVRMFFATLQGERLMNEAYGIPRWLFENFDVGAIDVLRERAAQGLARYEPRVRLIYIEAKRQELSGLTGVVLNIRYQIRSTGQEASITASFPQG